MTEEMKVKYQRLHEIAIRYGNGEKELAPEIIESFERYCWRYINVLKSGLKGNPDKQMLMFIRLFCGSIPPGKSPLHYYRSMSVKMALDNTSIFLKSVLERYTETDIKNEFVIILLELAVKYSKQNNGTPSFHTYVSRIFHFKAAKAIGKLIKDPIVGEFIDIAECNISSSSNLCEKIDENKLIAECDASLVRKDANILNDEISVFSDNFLNHHWSAGLTCSTVFKNLTQHERVILVDHCIYKLTDSQIAKKYGLCRATINRRRLKAIEKIKEIRELTEE